ncbi:FAD binding domain-containing protein [Mesorhizobium sp. YIM 152430]|uniref:FAD binding domain-containing protein n=1 Tax=Mesorhizobium sp. YIM 152430 TaxID=3031761 RepID=UPI0023DC94FD|nr:FAD binding domain-containing protein [Mesorhizobium sp. YIM 152430]MDF1601259.1 FAD binding domain-containing protein [Mesorhizobium sp. YIM 152430]
MKPAPIGYVRATDLAHALDLLAAGDGDEKVLAGGQSLVASLNLRLIESPNLIDINFIDELAGITESGDMVRVGTLTRHCELMASEIIARHVPILAEAAPLIAHAAIRTRGTIGGSLANADPAAELPACVVALDATIVLASKADGERRIKAADFFLGLFDTTRRDDEILVAIEIAKIKPGERQSIRELVRRSGDYALAGLAIAGPAAAPRLVFFGVGDAPVVASSAMAILESGGSVDDAALALEDDLDPADDINGSAGYKKHISRVLLKRALSDFRQSDAA